MFAISPDNVLSSAMLTVRELSRIISKLSRHERIRVALYALGITSKEAAEEIPQSKASIDIALSSGEREPTQEALEELVRKRLP